MFRLLLSLVLALGTSAALAQTKSSATKNRAPSSASSRMSTKQAREGLIAPGFHLTPMLGLALFDLPGADGVESDQGATVSALAEFGRGPLTYLTGLTYLQAGGRGAENEVDYTIRLDYIGIPALAKYQFDGDYRGAYVKGGLMPMAKVRSSIEAAQAGRRATADLDDIRKFDTLIQMGIGYGIPVGNGMQAGGELTFNRGVFHVWNDDSTNAVHQGWIASAFLTL